MNGAAPVRSAV